MARASSSSPFTKSAGGEPPVGPPLIGALLRMPWEIVRERMLLRLHEHGFDDLDVAHLNVLQYPGPDGVQPSELAKRLRVSKQALNYLLGQLERAGYLKRVTGEHDLRARRICMTARGDTALRVIREAVAEVEAEWAGLLGPRRFAQLRALLVELSRSES